MKDTVYYIFDIYNENSKDPISYVYSDNEEYVKMFLFQHRFHENSVYQIRRTHELTENNLYKLQPCIFRSNTKPEEFIIYTNYSLLESIIENCYVALEEAMIFPTDLIFEYQNFSIIEIINKLIYALPFASVQNYILDDSDREYIEYDSKFIKVFDSTNPVDYSANPDINLIDSEEFVRYLETSLTHATDIAMDEKLIMPITIESYVSGFIKYFS